MTYLPPSVCLYGGGVLERGRTQRTRARRMCVCSLTHEKHPHAGPARILVCDLRSFQVQQQ